MKQKKVQPYHLYPRLIDHVVKAMRKHVPKQLKKAPDEKLIHDFLMIEPKIMETLTIPSMSEEWNWERKSGVVIMPEDESMMQSLYRAKFELDSARHLKFPSNSFMLAVPSQCEIDGYQIKPAIVHWHPFEAFPEDFYEPFGRALGFTFGRGTPRLREGLDPSLPAISILFQDPVNKEGRLRLVVHCDDIPKVLSAGSPEEILDIVGNFDNSSYKGVIKPNQIDLHIQARLLKLVVAIGVYYTATEDSNTLQVGMPSSKHRFSQPKASYVKPMTLHSLAKRQSREQAEGEELSEHRRTWHFRQLRHSRYYQGEYASWPEGSRIVFVSDALVVRRRHSKDSPSDDDMLAAAANKH